MVGHGELPLRYGVRTQSSGCGGPSRVTATLAGGEANPCIKDGLGSAGVQPQRDALEYRSADVADVADVVLERPKRESHVQTLNQVCEAQRESDLLVGRPTVLGVESGREGQPSSVNAIGRPARAASPA